MFLWSSTAGPPTQVILRSLTILSVWDSLFACLVLLLCKSPSMHAGWFANPRPASAASSSAASSQGLQPRGLKRAAAKLYKRLAKKPRATSDLSNVPEHLKDDWHGYSRLEHMARTPMASTVLKGLNKKGADINWLCRDVCGAAVKEGSEFFHTRVLSTVSSERSFHSKLAKELPRVDLVSLPVQVRKKLGQQTFSCLLDGRFSAALFSGV